jgi:hypothetical protein
VSVSAISGLPVENAQILPRKPLTSGAAGARSSQEGAHGHGRGKQRRI